MARTVLEGARFAIHGSWTNGREVVNIFEAIVTTSVSRSAGLQEYATLISNEWTTDVLPRMANNYVHDRVDWVDLQSATGPTGTFTRATPAPGVLTAIDAGPQVARLATKNLASTARGSRSGRTFLAGIQEGAVNEDGVLDPTALALDQTALNSWLTSVTVTSGPGPLVAGRIVVVQWPSISVPQPEKRIPNPDGIGTPQNVSSFTIQTLISSQRRRVGR